MDPCYTLLEIKENITIPPKFFTNSDQFIMNQLKKKENKCTKYGYIRNIDKLIHKSDGMVYDVDFSGDLLINIIYTAYVCNPTIGSEINCEVVQIVLEDEFIAAEKHPLFINVIIDNQDREILEKLRVGEIIVIKIMAMRLNLNDNKIKIVGKYIKLANE